MTDDDLRRVFADAWESPEAARASWWLLAGRAVERAARAAAFREAAEVCDALWSSDDAEYHYIPDARGALITAMEALRARAEGDGEGGR